MIWFLIAVLAAGLLVLAVVSGSQTAPKKVGGKKAHVNKELVHQRWQAIQAMNSGTGSNLKSAVAEADKLLDYVMRQSGYGGETMAERLKRAQKNLSNRNAVWEAHKLRNALAHEVTFDLVPKQAHEAVAAYYQALKDLGAL
ncbi:MAG TPA: hypothetical protein VLF21_03205 [Candidatus Saccharimonadales bacterium]|nr:hypothetical protein [Candidatus Saccharimonadales bacterium]